MSLALDKNFVTSDELQMLLKEREEGSVDFILVDVREQYEYDSQHIKGVDMLKPTSMFQSWGEAFLNENKEKTVIFTCRTDNRSGQVQNVFKENGLDKVINHYGGIMSYDGETARG